MSNSADPIFPSRSTSAAMNALQNISFSQFGFGGNLFWIGDCGMCADCKLAKISTPDNLCWCWIIEEEKNIVDIWVQWASHTQNSNNSYQPKWPNMPVSCGGKHFNQKHSLKHRHMIEMWRWGMGTLFCQGGQHLGQEDKGSEYENSVPVLWANCTARQLQCTRAYR